MAPNLKGRGCERYLNRAESVEEALIDMYLVGVSTRRDDDISQSV
jgi:putative transposase